MRCRELLELGVGRGRQAGDGRWVGDAEGFLPGIWDQQSHLSVFTVCFPDVVHRCGASAHDKWICTDSGEYLPAAGCPDAWAASWVSSVQGNVLERSRGIGAERPGSQHAGFPLLPPMTYRPVGVTCQPAELKGMLVMSPRLV